MDPDATQRMGREPGFTEAQKSCVRVCVYLQTTKAVHVWERAVRPPVFCLEPEKSVIFGRHL